MNNLKSFSEYQKPEAVVNEMKVEDPKLQSEIREFAQLSDEIKKQKEMLEKLESKYKMLESAITPVLQELEETEDAILEVDDILVKIKSKGYQRENFKYADAFRWLEKRVNQRMREIVNEAKEANKTVSEIATKLGIERMNEGFDVSIAIDRLMKAIKETWNRFADKIKSYNKDMKSDIADFKKML